jgi:hypothetical protein
VIFFVADGVPSFHRYVPPPVAVKVILVVEQSKIVVADVIEVIGSVVLEVIVVLAVAVQPLLAVTTTEYVPAVVIFFVAEVVPSFHTYVPPPLAVKVMLDVVQSKTEVDDVIVAVGKVVLEVIVVLAVAVQPLLAVTTTEYVPAVVMFFVAEVVPSFHRYVPPPVAVNVILVVEQSKIVDGEVIEAIGNVVLEVIVVLAVAVQPLLAVTTTEYVPAVMMFLVDDVVPSFHK